MPSAFNAAVPWAGLHQHRRPSALAVGVAVVGQHARRGDGQHVVLTGPAVSLAAIGASSTT